ncbi:MAG: hypothetical protein EB078_07940 [Proteobacteria bacterium]|nr:hypothetical protein [Pseudomonadota bacterium]NDC24638.1 hypothetical protein [Pseudomonadota bacterium]NDD04822.1 hypothetical protein [Pseudomonadota bacterium]NDG26738.1 hypothetical protein [Pseudomonadota bacterium]
MRQFLGVGILLWATASSSLIGAPAASTTPEKSTAVLNESVNSPTPTKVPTLIEVGTGIATAITGAQPGVHVGINVPLGKSGLYVGGETGGYFYTAPQFGTYLPILASIAARFDLGQNSYVMLGLSPGIGLVSYDTSKTTGVIVGKDYSDVYFNLLLKPTFNLMVGEGTLVMISPRVGALNGALMFSPVIGTSFEL